MKILNAEIFTEKIINITSQIVRPFLPVLPALHFDSKMNMAAISRRQKFERTGKIEAKIDNTTKTQIVSRLIFIDGTVLQRTIVINCLNAPYITSQYRKRAYLWKIGNTALGDGVIELCQFFLCNLSH